MKIQKNITAKFLAFLVCVLALSGCLNIFSPIDAPSGDVQLLSAARAALDRGDYTQAATYYGQLSSSYSDQKISGDAYGVLRENGAGLQSMVSALGQFNGTPGSGLTSLADSMANAAGISKRVAVQSALISSQSIVDPQLQAFVELVTSVALASELLAETTSNGILYTTNVATDGTACTATSCLTTGCVAPVNFPLGTNPTDVMTANLGSGSPDLNTFNSAINYAYTATQKLGLSGGVYQQIAAINPNTNQQCYRALLISLGIGQ